MKVPGVSVTEPFNLDAEESVLGAMLLTSAAIDTVHEILGDGSSFYRDSHGVIYRALVGMHRRGEPADPILVVEELRSRGELELAEPGKDGAQRVHELAALVPSVSNVAHYARLVLAEARRRDQLRILREGELRILREGELRILREGELHARNGGIDVGWLERIRAAVEPAPSQLAASWLSDAADLLAEPDPGPTPWLVDGLIVDQALVALVGKWKTTKSYGLLDLCVSIATGRPAFGRVAIPNPGPVVFVNEESGRTALWRRLDALCRGRAIDPEELRGSLHVAANAGVRLDDPKWQDRLLRLADDVAPRLICFDPLARMKDSAREENAQSDMAPLIEFMRRLRDATGAAVCFVHHVGHQGKNMRGSSDLESAWETRLEWERDGTSPEVAVKSEHREADAGDPIRYWINWDGLTRSMRFDLIEDDLIGRVREYLRGNPTASKNEVAKALGGRKASVLEAVDLVRGEGGSAHGNYPGTTPSAAPLAGGSQPPPFRGAGTTSGEPGSDDAELERLEAVYAEGMATLE